MSRTIVDRDGREIRTGDRVRAVWPGTGRPTDRTGQVFGISGDGRHVAVDWDAPVAEVQFQPASLLPPTFRDLRCATLQLLPATEGKAGEDR